MDNQKYGWNDSNNDFNNIFLFIFYFNIGKYKWICFYSYTNNYWCMHFFFQFSKLLPYLHPNHIKCIPHEHWGYYATLEIFHRTNIYIIIIICNIKFLFWSLQHEYINNNYILISKISGFFVIGSNSPTRTEYLFITSGYVVVVVLVDVGGAWSKYFILLLLLYNT